MLAHSVYTDDVVLRIDFYGFGDNWACVLIHPCKEIEITMEYIRSFRSYNNKIDTVSRST